jgi:vancomycin aglycone glucosyltransferase
LRALLSSVGTRGDVQPLVALALQVRELGHEVRLCVPPNFVPWAQGLGLEARPLGVEMRLPTSRPATAPLTPEQLRALRASMPDLITEQFDVLEAAAEGCDVILGANAHQYAARSIAELRGGPSVTALYAPVALPSTDHAPPGLPGRDASHEAGWRRTRAEWNERALERLNHNRTRRGLAPIDDVLTHTVGDHPWLAADVALAPAPPGVTVFETGAWVLEDSSPLPPELVRFLDAGAPPLCFGFGSMPAAPELSRTLIEAARAVGRRALISRGWARLGLIDDAPDCLAIGDVNHQALFPRVAAVVHHGGAGTTATAARAGAPQVVAPMFSDQFSWGSRVAALGLGSSVGALTTEVLAAALHAALRPEVAARARGFVSQLRADGARVAAQRLVNR